ncbi:hypothetical protein ACSQ6I_23545 [Anabaena sp. WFMT]|uniref:hypothetical protein n=1 Tax=Anabaena sp. WFMT TaxID=3449730 RepID=UPI003F1F77CF
MALSEIQLKSIELLLSGEQQKSVAIAIGVNVKTLQRWSKHPEYYATLNNLPIPQPTTEQTPRATETTETPQKTTKILLSRDIYRQNELELLDALQKSLETILENDSNNLRVIDRLLKISQQRSELLGLKIKEFQALTMLDNLTREGLIPPQISQILAGRLKQMYDDVSAFTQSLPLPSQVE